MTYCFEAKYQKFVAIAEDENFDEKMEEALDELPRMTGRFEDWELISGDWKEMQ